MPKKKNYPGYPGGGVVGLRGRIPGYQETGEVQESMFQRLLKRIGGWDNRLGGEEEAREQDELRQLMRESERKKREPELWRLIHEERERRRIQGRGDYSDSEPVPLPEPDLSRYEQSLRRASDRGRMPRPTANADMWNILSERERQKVRDYQTGRGGQIARGEDYESSQVGPMIQEGRGRDIVQELIRGRASGGIIGLQEGGRAGMAPGQSQVTSYGVPQQTEQQWANLTDRIVTEGQRPYQQYGGPRMAGFTAPEAAAMAGRVAYGQGVGPQGTIQAGQTLGQAAQGISGLIPQQQALGQQAQLQGQLAGAGMRATGAAAQAEQQALGAGQAAAGQAGQVQMTGLGQQMGTAGQAALGAQQQFGTGMTGMGTAAQQLGQTAMGQMGQTGVQSQAQAQQAAQRMRDIGGQAPDLQRTANLQDYMSQYTAGVTDPQLQQLMEFQKMQGQELGSAAAQSGAFGGARADIEQRKLREQTGQQAAEIIGKGQQQAFETAQQAFQADRAAKQQAQQTGLSAEQQAAATQAGAQGQALAAQQAGVGAAQAGSAQQMQAQQQAAGMADVGAGRQMQGIQGQGGLTAQGIGMGQQGLAAQQAAASTGAGLGLQGQQQGFQAAQTGVQQRMGAQQAAMGGYGQLAGVGGQQLQLGGQQQAQQLERLRDVQGVGAEQRAMQDRSLGIGYQDWQNRQNQERQNIGWQQQAMSGLPYQGSVTQTAYGTPRSGTAGLMDTGLGAMGLYNAYRGQQGQQPSYQATQANPVAQVTPFQGTPITPTTVGNPAMQNYQATQQNPVAQVTPFQGTSITPNFRGGRVW